MLAFAEPQHLDAQQRPRAEVEGPPGLLGGEAHHLGLGLALAQPREVTERRAEVARGRDDLRGQLAHPLKSRAQDFVAAHNLGQRALEGAHVEVAFEAHREWNVEGRAVGVEAVENPEALLRVGERPLAVERDGLDGREARRAAVAHGLLNHLGHARDRRRLEDGVHGQLGLEGALEPRRRPERQQRVAAQLEEVVPGADALVPQHLRPDARDDLFDGRERRVVGPRVRPRLGHVSGQCLSINLAVGRERHRVQLEERGRNHVLGQSLAQVALQLLNRASRALLPDHVARQAQLSRLAPAREDDGLPDPFLLADDRLDLAQLDAIAAHLHLLVNPAHVFQQAVGAEPAEVAAAVEPARRARRQRVGGELLGRQRGALEVAARDPFAADVDLADDAGRHGPTLSSSTYICVFAMGRPMGMTPGPAAPASNS